MPRKLQNIVAAARYPLSSVGFAFGEVTADSLYAAINADSLMIPASVQKLLTGAAALEILGGDYHFRTTVFCDTGFNPDSGIVNGNLYIRGGGDPGILTERLWLLAQQIHHRGVRAIEKDLVLDDGFFDTAATGPGYEDDSTGRAYEAPVSALAATFNCVCVHIRPASMAGDPVRAELFPPLRGAALANTARTIAAGRRGSIEMRTDLVKGTLQVSISGTMAIGEEPRYVYRKALQPWRNFGEAMRAFLRDSGVRVVGTIRRGALPAAADTLLVFESQPLFELVGDMFKYSSNFAAEMMFKAVAARVDPSRPGSWEGGARALLDWWVRKGLPAAPIARNGSGMGRTNRISPAQIVALLRYVWRQKTYLPEYLSALSVAGVDGTLASRFKNSPLAGIVRAKTGTLNDYGVSTLAGYVLLPDRTCAFAILINNPKGQQFASWTLQEKLLEAAVARLRSGM